MTRPKGTTFAILVVALMIIARPVHTQQTKQAERKAMVSKAGGTRFSPLNHIHRGNVTRLRRAWTYHTGELNMGEKPPAFEATPLEVDGVLYFTTPSSRVIALDAETGKELWAFDPQAGRESREYLQNRGVSYWENGKEKRIVYGTLDGKLIALDAATGEPDAHFGDNGIVDLRHGAADKWPKASYKVTSPPAIYKNLAIVGSALQESPSLGPSGMVRAFDVRSGQLAWEFHTVPQPGETGHETWEGDSWKDRSGANAWAPISVDFERGMVFLATGSPTYDFYGADRKGQNLFGNSLVALDAATGKLKWHFQTTHHDLWDYDLPAQPVLVTARGMPAVAQVTKMGFVFVLDRATGTPVFPVEERPVPASKVPGEATWPTQPFPLKPPPLSRQQPITRADVNEVTECLQLFDSLVSGGLYTPLGLEQTLVWPGTLGGGNWSGASFDPSSGYLFVNTNEMATYGAMKEQPPGSPVRYRKFSKFGEFAHFDDRQQRPCQKPPWGWLSAVDLKTGEIAWRVPLGGATGAWNLGGSMVTAGGLVFIGGTNDSRFRAFDAHNGKQLWDTPLEASGHATPMTYRGKKTKKQFVVIAAGGGGFLSESEHGVSDVLAAYALP
ncbi:MAG: pyrroloquinoline quinone-dependent dehydrogenase [Acidobacteriota bacterium]